MVVNRVVLDNGTITYRTAGVLHRANGPAIRWVDDTWSWVLYDDWHRYYGPQSNNLDWWIHDVRVK